jgi:hypothetical protein
LSSFPGRRREHRPHTAIRMGLRRDKTLAMSKVSPDREVDRLFALPLDEFTSARNDAVKRLKNAGEDEAAERVAALAKPSVPVWTINQLARQDKAAMKALLDAAAKLRKAQERALAGGSRDALREAQRNERDALRDLTHRAEGILEQAGRPTSRPVLERVRSTLGAAALADPTRGALKAGRLTDEVEMSGFDVLAGIEPAPRKRGEPRDELAERRKQKAERERERRRLEKNARDLEARAKSAEERADEAEEAAEEARSAADEHRRAADAAAAELAAFDE